MNRISPLLIGLLVLCLPAAAFALTATFETFDLPIDLLASWGVSQDGSRICTNLGGQIYLYENDVFTPIAQVNHSSAGLEISDDGTAIVTTVLDSLGYTNPAILREANGWVPEPLELPADYLPCDSFRGSGFSINEDGTKIVGLLWDGCDARCFLWTEETGIQDLGKTRGTVISDDGGTIGGFTSHFGTGTRRPAYWTVTGNMGSIPFDLDNPEDEGEVLDMTSNGGVLVGTAYPLDRPIQDIFGYQAFIWSPGDPDITLLGTLSGSNYDISKATLVANNNMVFGVSGPSSINVTAFVWTPATGLTNLRQFLIDHGAEGVTPSIRLGFPSAVSSDGSTLVGYYSDLYGGFGYYKATFDNSSPAVDIPGAGAHLTGVHPNPFNPQTTVEFVLDRAMRTRVSVHDLTGRRIAVLAEREFGAGDHRLTWRGTDATGRQVASGAYVIRLENDEGTDSRLVTLVK